MTRVLIVDDDEDLRSTTRLLLEFEGLEVFEAENGQAALDLLRAGLAPDLLLVDLMMPVMDGAILCRAVQSDPSTAGIPIVVLSARHDAPEQGQRCGAREVLRKPVSFPRLLAAVAAHAQAIPGTTTPSDGPAGHGRAAPP